MYDDFDQLQTVTATLNGQAAPSLGESFSFDAIGNHTESVYSTKAGQNRTPPEFEGPEGAFHLAVEVRGEDASLDVTYSVALQRGVEPFAELRAVVGDKEAGPAMLFDGMADEACQ